MTNAQVGELLAPLVSDPDVSVEVASFAAVALGLVFVGTCHASSVEAILQVRAFYQMQILINC